jgi:hypothetical protein
MSSSARYIDGLVVLTCVAALLLWWALFHNAQLDDPFITFRYSRNLINGFGPVWNPGEPPVEGYTNFLWMILCAAGLAAGFEPLMFARLVGILAMAAILVVGASSVNPLASRREAWRFFALALALNPIVGFYAVSGMETLLFALLAFCGACLYARSLRGDGARDRVVAALFFAAAALCRPEGLGCFGIALIYQLLPRHRPHRRPLAQLVLPFLAIWGVFFLWRLSYYGQLFPNTYYAKQTGDLWFRLRGFLSYFAPGFAVLLGIPLVALLCDAAARAPGDGADLDEAAGFFRFAAVAYFSYLTLIGGDDQGAFPSYRLFVPGLPLVYAAVMAPIARFARAAGSSFRGRLTPALLLAATVLATGGELRALVKLGLPSVGSTTRLGDLPALILDAQPTDPRFVALAKWIVETTPRDAVIACGWAGVVPYLSDRRFIDLLGLNDAHIAHVPRRQGGVDSKFDAPYVLSRNPALIILNVDPQIAAGTPETIARSVWRLGEREMLYALKSDPQYRLDLTAPGNLTVFRRVAP